MAQILNYIKIIRPINIGFVIITQYMLRYLVYMPIFESCGKHSGLSELNFLFLVISTSCIAAAGYIINDYFDIRIDNINKPNKVIVSNHIDRRTAIAMHWTLNTVGILLGFYVAWQVGNIKLGAIHILSAASLWFYSSNYKKQFLVGNLIVGVLTAMIILTVMLYEPIIFSAKSFSEQLAVRDIMILSFTYAFFSFMISIIREIVKDIEDIKGDASYYCNTIPVVIGVNKSKIVIFILTGLLLVGTYFVQISPYVNQPWIYIFSTIQIPLVYMLWLLKKADKKADYTLISKMIKLIMFLGICSMGYFYYLMKYSQ